MGIQTVSRSLIFCLLLALFPSWCLAVSNFSIIACASSYYILFCPVWLLYLKSQFFLIENRKEVDSERREGRGKLAGVETISRIHYMRKEFVFNKMKKFKKNKKYWWVCLCKSDPSNTRECWVSSHRFFLSLSRRFRWLEEGEMEKAYGSEYFRELKVRLLSGRLIFLDPKLWSVTIWNETIRNLGFVYQRMKKE